MKYIIPFKMRNRDAEEQPFPGFSWDRVSFLPSSCCVSDLIGEDDNTDIFSCCYEIKDFFQSPMFS